MKKTLSIIVISILLSCSNNVKKDNYKIPKDLDSKAYWNLIKKYSSGDFFKAKRMLISFDEFDEIVTPFKADLEKKHPEVPRSETLFSANINKKVQNYIEEINLEGINLNKAVLSFVEVDTSKDEIDVLLDITQVKHHFIFNQKKYYTRSAVVSYKDEYKLLGVNLVDLEI